MSKVFVTQQPRQNRRGWIPDLSPASAFGAIHYVFDGDARPNESTKAAVAHALDVLRDFDHDKDYLLWPNTGDPVAMWATTIAATSLGIPSIRILYWERKRVNGVPSTTDGFYTPLNLPIPTRQPRKKGTAAA